MDTNMSPLQELTQILKQRSVKTGLFTLASGKTSDFYVDARQSTLYPRGAYLIAQLILSRLHPEVTAIGGPVTGADPITGAVVALSASTDRPINGFMVRKAAKGYGAQNWLEGQAGLEAGCAVCVVEDTVTTGGIHAPTVLTRADKRDILRDTVFLCKTPFDTPRINSG